MFSNKEKTQKTKVMEINVVAKNTTINGDIISEGDFRIDGTLEGNIKTKGRVIIGIDGSVKGKNDGRNRTSISPNIYFKKSSKIYFKLAKETSPSLSTKRPSI